jgi:hypothetical protein
LTVPSPFHIFPLVKWFGVMSRSGHIALFALIGVIGLLVAGWAGYAFFTMQPHGTYVMRATGDDSDDAAFAVCTFHPSIGSYFRRGGLGLGALAGACVTLVAVSALRQLKGR